MERSFYNTLLRADLAAFIGKTLSAANPAARYIPGWHVDLIAEYLEALRKGKVTRLIINMPPRSLKSTCVSVAWPAWLMGKDPRSRIIAASYSASLAHKHSLDCRMVMASPWYENLFPATAFSKDQNEKHKFATTARGFRMATSIGGSTLGEGGNFLIIDDPLNPEQAESKLSRHYANRWFDHTFASRLDDKHKGVIVLAMQRLHENDLTGHLLSKGGWAHVSLPAVTAEPIIYNFGRFHKEREAGELMQEKRENHALIERARIELGSSAFSAQYQQAPLAEEGAMLRASWFARYSQAPSPCERTVQSWDTAIKSGAIHDASVCLTFGEHGGKSYLRDVKVMRVEYPDLKRIFHALAEQWRPDAILIEDKSSGQQLLQDARYETSLPVIAMKPQGDKITRFAAVSAMIEAGRVALPETAPWLAEFEQELSAFPLGKHDDQVDALTQYLDWLRSQNRRWMRIRQL